MTNNPLQALQRCFAKTRTGALCQAKPVRGRKRCRMHGGTNNGAPKGNKNAFKHGMRSKETIENRKYVNSLIRQYKDLTREMEL